jgi:hypothetical protein
MVKTESDTPQRRKAVILVLKTFAYLVVHITPMSKPVSSGKNCWRCFMSLLKALQMSSQSKVWSIVSHGRLLLSVA